MNKKGFTLIELLAVIIILGILMIIAIPSVTSYINNSRKSAYVNTAKELVSGARNVVNDGKLEMYSTDTTYYIPSSYIKTENASKSPYGEFIYAYVGVIYDGTGYKYYWISVDETKQGVKDIVAYDKLDEDDIVSGINPDEINTAVHTTGIGNRHYIKILKSDGTWETPIYLDDISNNVSEEGGGSPSGSGSGGEITPPVPPKIICKRATTLHTEKCTWTYGDYCYADGYSTSGSKGTQTITYGTVWDGESAIKTGDAFDCDINDDGVYDSTTERFYYVSDYFDTNTQTFDSNYAALIYYKNTIGGVPSDNGIAYYSANNTFDNWHGPITAIAELPSTTGNNAWRNDLLKTTDRKIQACSNENCVSLVDSTTGGTITYPTPIYAGKAARLIHAKEIKNGCVVDLSVNGSLNGICRFLMENTRYISYYDKGSFGTWVENPLSGNSQRAILISSGYRRVGSVNANNNEHAARPVIDVLKTSISN